MVHSMRIVPERGRLCFTTARVPENAAECVLSAWHMVDECRHEIIEFFRVYPSCRPITLDCLDKPISVQWSDVRIHVDHDVDHDKYAHEDADIPESLALSILLQKQERKPHHHLKDPNQQ